jgi:hypothetical protein
MVGAQPDSQASSTASTLKAILVGGLLVAVLDLTEVIAVYGLAVGMRPFRVPQAVASAVLGRASFGLGAKSVLLGLLLHTAVAFSVVAVYAVASRWLPALDRHPTLSGLAYGLGVYAFMHLLVLPLSAMPKEVQQFELLGFLNGIFGHPLFVGLPTAWAVHVLAPKP